MPQTHVQVRNELQSGPLYNGWRLCLQRCRYVHPHHDEHGFRFIWRFPGGQLQPARGQARIPALRLAQALIDRAITADWGNIVEEAPENLDDLSAAMENISEVST